MEGAVRLVEPRQNRREVFRQVAVSNYKSSESKVDSLGKLEKQPKKPAQKIKVLALHPE
jgi:proline dehydrogenase